MLSDVGTEALAIAYSELGAAAVYRSAGMGAPVAVTVIQRSPDRLADFNGGQFVTGTSILKVRAAELPTVAQGDTFEIGTQTFAVFAAPLREDAAKLEWTCWVK